METSAFAILGFFPNWCVMCQMAYVARNSTQSTAWQKQYWFFLISSISYTQVDQIFLLSVRTRDNKSFVNLYNALLPSCVNPSSFNTDRTSFLPHSTFSNHYISIVRSSITNKGGKRTFMNNHHHVVRQRYLISLTWLPSSFILHGKKCGHFYQQWQTFKWCLEHAVFCLNSGELLLSNDLKRRGKISTIEYR